MPDADGPAAPAAVRAPAPPALVLLFKPYVKGARWKRVAAVASYAEAVGLIDAGGNWWIAEARGCAEEESES